MRQRGGMMLAVLQMLDRIQTFDHALDCLRGALGDGQLHKFSQLFFKPGFIIRYMFFVHLNFLSHACMIYAYKLSTSAAVNVSVPMYGYQEVSA